MENKCKVYYCNNISLAKGYCNKHYLQVRKYGKIKEKITGCKIEWCNNKTHEALGYCSKHYQQYKKTGEIKRYSIKDRNEIIIKRKYIYVVINSKKGRFISFTNKEYLEKIRKYKWSIGTHGYAVSSDNGKNISMQSLIVCRKNNMVIDHINMKKLDNRLLNLRLASKSLNGFNRKSKGIIKYNNRYKVQIGYNYKTIYIGTFLDKKEAIEARKNAEIKYFKENSFYYKSL